MTGLLVMLLVGPVCVLLAVSVIGIAVIPFLLCALLIAVGDRQDRVRALDGHERRATRTSRRTGSSRSARS